MARQLWDSKITDDDALDETREPQRRRSIGRLGGLLFCAGALVFASSALTFGSGPSSWVLAVIVLAFVTGVVSLSIPWERISAHWIHVLAVTGTLEVTAGVWASGADGEAYAWLYLMVVIMVAYAFRSRAVIGAHVAFVSICLAVPLIDPATSAQHSLRNLLVSAPTLVIAAVLVAYFRERLEAGKNAYQVLSERDPLTGVGNYRIFHERLDYEIARHQRHQRRFVVMVLDLSGFKQVNETRGHLEGDRVLREVGRVLSDTVRDQDTVARQGGDEFSVLAPETTNFEAAALADRLRQALGTIPVGDRGLSASIGWAIYPEHGLTVQELLAHADDELLRSKASALVYGSVAGDPARLQATREDRSAVAEAGSAGARS
jgi:diguanylate cyclase (GGDEF)-like protein